MGRVYAAPSTRGQWQANAYNIFVPRSQSYMTERAREKSLPGLERHYKSGLDGEHVHLQSACVHVVYGAVNSLARCPISHPAPPTADAKPLDYSVHSPQVTGSPFALAPVATGTARCPPYCPFQPHHLLRHVAPDICD